MNQQIFLGQLSAAGLLLAASSLFYSRIFAGPAWIPPVLGAIVLSFALAVVLSRTTMALFLRALALVAFGVLFVGIAVLLPGTSFGSFSEIGSTLVAATVDGWRNTLAETLPISTAVPEALGFVTTLAWITGSVTGALLVRSQQAASTAVPPIIFAAISLPLGAPDGTVAYFLIAGLIASALLLTLVRAVPQSQLDSTQTNEVKEFIGERMLTERLVSGAIPLIILALGAPLIALAVTSDDPFDPRQLREENVMVGAAVNPLAELKSLREAGEPAFSLNLPAAPSAVFFDRLGLVSLESYDGVNWTTSSTYAEVGTEVEIPFEQTVETLTVRQEIEFLDDSPTWLPAGQPVTRIEANDIWFDSDLGSLLNRGEEGARTYVVESQIAAPSEEQQNAALADRSDSRFLELPAIDPDSPIVELTMTIEGSTDFERLESLEATLRDELTLVNEERSGSAIGRVEEFLVDGEGYRDQFVTAFAVAARQQGFPARVQVGYRITQEAEDSVMLFRDMVTTEQYDAWPEVLFEGIGWVAFDPVPQTSGEARFDADDATQIPEGQPARQGPTPSADDPVEDDELDQDDLATSASLRVLVASGLFVVFFPLMLLVVIVLAKLLRRRYRRNLEDPTERVLAGWQESKDRLLEAGIAISPDMTVKEIVTHSRRELGVHASSSLSTLAPYVTTTIYSDREPSEAAADTVWNEVQLFDSQLNESRSRTRKWRARIDPRPLLEKV